MSTLGPASRAALYLFQRDVAGPEPTTYATTGVHGTFELIVRALGKIPTP